ncbi:MAG: DUF952 domain-containing protein [Cyanothece sp. SIO1E1]|nr:DUF952 domain-containing protein [Cyanothece sp. SIO1E1]
MEMLYHITSAAEARIAEAQGWYEPATFAQEGFIHCAFVQQILGVSSRYYAGQQGLVLLTIEPTAVGCEIRVENLMAGAELFPHVYGRLPWAAVPQIYDFPCDATGVFTLPERLVG